MIAYSNPGVGQFIMVYYFDTPPHFNSPPPNPRKSNGYVILWKRIFVLGLQDKRNHFILFLAIYSDCRSKPEASQYIIIFFF